MSIIKTQKSFSINEWKRGAKVETQDGRSVRIFSTDIKDENEKFLILAAIDNGYNEEVLLYKVDGTTLGALNDNFNLVIVEEREVPDRWADDKDAMGPGWYINALSVVAPGRVQLNDPHNMRFFASEKLARSARAMARISQLIANDKRYGGPITSEEWNNDTKAKFVIVRMNTTLETDSYFNAYAFLAFHTREQRDLFLAENKRLVKDFLMVD